LAKRIGRGGSSRPCRASRRAQRRQSVSSRTPRYRPISTSRADPQMQVIETVTFVLISRFACWLMVCTGPSVTVLSTLAMVGATLPPRRERWRSSDYHKASSCLSTCATIFGHLAIADRHRLCDLSDRPISEARIPRRVARRRVLREFAEPLTWCSGRVTIAGARSGPHFTNLPLSQDGSVSVGNRHGGRG